MPKFIRVTTSEMLIDIAVDFYFINDMPMFIASETPINAIVASHAYTLRRALCPDGKPMFYHFIYYGSGALLITTSLTGNSLSLKAFQNFNIEIGLLFY
jgi:hypothetical protein